MKHYGSTHSINSTVFEERARAWEGQVYAALPPYGGYTDHEVWEAACILADGQASNVREALQLIR